MKNIGGDKLIKEILWLIAGIGHSFVHPDSSFISLKQTGYTNWEVIFIILISSTIGTVICYYLNIGGVSLAKRNRIANWIIEYLRGKSNPMVKIFGYFGLVALSLIPYAVGFRETAMIVGQVLALEFILPIVLTANALRILLVLPLFYF